MAKGHLPVVNGDASAVQAIAEAGLLGAWPLLDALPFPVLEIQADYTVSRLNRAAQRAYGDKLGKVNKCYALSHGHQRPCDQVGETCPKLAIAEGAGHATVRHAHLIHDHVEPILVSAHALENGGILEFHIPLDDNLARDKLTGLYQRDFFDHLIARQINLLDRMDVGYAVAIVDLDFFKAVNDTHGHAAGDRVLKAVGQVLLNSKRSGDSVARWGGEEFCIFLPSADLGGAHTQAKRTLAAIKELRVTLANGEVLEISASIGVAMAMPKDAFAGVVKRADQALYAAKEAGRDQIKLAEGPRDPRRP